MSDELITKCKEVLDNYKQQVDELYQSIIGKVIVKKADKTQGCSCSFLIKESVEGLDKPLDPLDRRVRLEHYTMCEFCKSQVQKGTTLREVFGALANGIGEISVIDSIKAGDNK